MGPKWTFAIGLLDKTGAMRINALLFHWTLTRVSGRYVERHIGGLEPTVVGGVWDAIWVHATSEAKVLAFVIFFGSKQAYCWNPPMD